MSATFTKIFEFSASHSRDGRVLGHNYVLRFVFLASDVSVEEGLTEKIEIALIRKLHSRDLGDVDFLKHTAINDLALLRAFWPIALEATRPAQLHSLCLERDRVTQWTLTPSD